jgi:hypothetical protein
MKIIIAKCGSEILVDDEDYVFLSKYKWHLNYKGYAKRSEYAGKKDGKRKTKTYSLHRELMGALGYNGITDHIDGNPLNNQKSNLRLADARLNAFNRKSQRNSISCYKGVSKSRYGWRARIMSEGKSIHVGYFNTEIEAANAYNLAAKKHHGEFARMNEVA